MNDNNLCCYITNDSLLGRLAKRAASNFDSTSSLHVATSIISSLQGIIALSITLGSSYAEVSYNELKSSESIIHRKPCLRVDFEPISEILQSQPSKTLKYQKVSSEIEHDVFSKISDEIYGRIIKFTTFIKCKDERNAKKMISELSSSIINNIINNDLDKNIEIILPIGGHIFKVKIKYNYTL